MLQPVQGVLCVEGTQSGDGRLIQEGALAWVDPPLPLAWIEDGDQHVDMVSEAPQVGTIETITRVGNLIGFTGFIDDEIEEGEEMIRRMQAGSAPLGNRFGLSIDPDDWEVELVDTTGEYAVLMVASGQGMLPRRSLATLVAAAGDGDPGGDVIMEDSAESLIQRYTRLRIRGATCCSVAAFDGAYLELANAAAAGTNGNGTQAVMVTVTPVAEAQTLDFAAHSAFNGIHSHPHSAYGVQGSDEQHSHEHEHQDDAVHDHHVVTTASGEAQALESFNSFHRAGGRIRLLEGQVQSADFECEDCDESLTAAGGPLLPPAAWFDNPNFQMGDSRLVRQPNGSYLCPLTVTPEGRVFGHMAGWSSCHTGHLDACVTPPRSPSSYAYFNDGPLPTAEGDTVYVGQLTMGCGHPDEPAARPFNWKQAKAHYDGGPAAVQMADVHVGEDQFGIWFSGALRPDVSDEQVRAFRACGVSGDWREVVRGKGLDLIACAAGVVSEGFQIASLAASADIETTGCLPTVPFLHIEDGRPVALVASGIVRQPLPWERAMGEQAARIEALEARLVAAEAITAVFRPDAVRRYVAAAGAPVGEAAQAASNGNVAE